ncbi:hypothetical protein Q5752_006521 [Cryptotrichosporon argae]
MPTPPSLPNGFPSSDRLRRLAPSPVKVPRPLLTSGPLPCALPRPGPAQPAGDEKRHSIYQSPLTSPLRKSPSPRAAKNPFEIDPHPTAALSSGSGSSRPGAGTGASAATSTARGRVAYAVPLIYDVAGHHAALARRAWDVLGPDVPEWDGERCRRADELLLSPQSYCARFEPAPVFVEFRDVFGPAPTVKTLGISPECAGSSTVGRSGSLASTLPPLPPLSPLTPDVLSLPSFAAGPSRRAMQTSSRPSLDALVPPLIVRDGSCGTFGTTTTTTGADRRPSTDTMRTAATTGDDEDGWTYSLSAYGDDRSEKSPPPPFMPAPTFAMLELTELDDDDYDDGRDVNHCSCGRRPSSPSSVDTEVITPAHGDVDLPSRNPSVCSSTSGDAHTQAQPQTSTPRGRLAAPKAESALGLSLGPALAPRSAISDLCPSPSATLVPSPGVAPSTYLAQRHGNTLGKALPSLHGADKGELATPRLSPALLPRAASTPTQPAMPAKHETPTNPAFPAWIHSAICPTDRELTVQLWVDQEGARDVRSSLHYVRACRADSFRILEATAQDVAAHTEPFQQTGCIEYGMDQRGRDQWFFHYSPLQSLPVLRRLTINGDDKHDHLARETTLQIRDPGVWAITGGSGDGRGEAAWQFSYLVTPRLCKQTGELVPNERVVVPLALRLGPRFFDSERASNSHLSLMLKKTLAVNVPAVKVRPPIVGKPPGHARPDAGQRTASGGSVAPAKAGGGSPTAPPRAQTPPSPPAAQSAVSRTTGVLAHAKASTFPSPLASASATPAPVAGSPAVHAFGTKPATAGAFRPGRLRTPTGLDTELAAEDERDAADAPPSKGRRRALTIFSGARRPLTAPLDNTVVPPLPPLSRKPSSALRLAPPPPPPGKTDAPRSPVTQTPRWRRHHASASGSGIGIVHISSPLTSPHPFATHIPPPPTSAGLVARLANPRPRTSPSAICASPRSAGSPGVPRAQATVLARTGIHWDSTDVEVLAADRSYNALRRAGVSPARVKKRPSTAEPRLGAGSAFGLRGRI